MGTLILGGRELAIKDYYCAGDSGEYPPKTDGRLWLYVHITDQCPAACPFCVHSSQGPRPRTAFDPDRFRRTLELLRDRVYGVSLTGGEPMLEPELMEGAIAAVTEVLPPELELDLATNGTALDRLPRLRGLERFTAIHLSRHAVEDTVNARLMAWTPPTRAEIARLLGGLPDPGALVFNCVLQRGGVEDLAGAAAYLDMAGELGVRNTSFIGFFPANRYCREHYVSPAALDLDADPRFRVWNRLRDHDFCSCVTGDYLSPTGWTRFYCRCPGAAAAPWCRQLVYESDNRLLDGFGGRELRL